MQSHRSGDVSDDDVRVAVEKRRRDIENDSALSEDERQTRLNLLEQLSAFPLGRSLLVNRSLSGFWTDAIVNRPANTPQYANETE